MAERNRGSGGGHDFFSIATPRLLLAYFVCTGAVYTPRVLLFSWRHALLLRLYCFGEGGIAFLSVFFVVVRSLTLRNREDSEP